MAKRVCWLGLLALLLTLACVQPCRAQTRSEEPAVELVCEAGVPFRWRLEGGQWHETRSNRHWVPGLDAQGRPLVYEVAVDAPAGLIHRWSFHRGDLKVIQFLRSGYRFEPKVVLDVTRVLLTLALAVIVASLFGFTHMRRSRELRLRLDETRERLSESEARAGLFPLDGSAPTRVDGYEVVKKIGVGGMAVVYHVRRNGTDHAMKLPLPNVLDDDDFRARFAREAKVAATLHHPNIVHVYDVNDGLGDFGYPYLVMDLVNGVSLKERLRMSMMPVEVIGQVGLQVLDALAYLHQRGIVHRDIKPANIMVCPNGGARLMDFGIAYAASAHSGRLTRTGDLLGTPMYFAPEQFVDDHQSIDPRIDVYGAGMLLYEALAGRFPWSGDDSMALMLDKMSKAPTELREACPHVSLRVSDVVMRMISRDPEARYPTAAEARDALRAALAG
ncbi:MAG: serine/threonine protein kinase [Proteobacteria bacterium]|nr:serine/threonine protein kinase [Pseudomonadota bacterium]